MFSDKERNWITGKYENIINYDSWQQWIEYVHAYNASNPLLWNIKETDGNKNTHTIQILYMAKNGEIKIICIFIVVKASDEDNIRSWLKSQKWHGSN